MAYEYERSPLLAAQEGDTGPLCQRLRALALTLKVPDAANVRFAADLIEGKIKLPPHRPPSVVTQVRDIDIARRYEELTRGGGNKHDAITAITQEFRCTPSIVNNAVNKARKKRL